MKNLFLLLVVAAGSYSAFSQEEGYVEEKFEESDLAGQSSDMVASSRGIRDTKKFNGGLSLGIMMSIMPGADINASYAYQPNLRIGARLATAEIDMKDEVASSAGAELTKAKIIGAEYEAFARYFLGNSFYTQAGLGLRKIRIEVAARNLIGDTAEIYGQADSFAASLSIGNEWSFKNGVTIGARWLAYSVPMSKDTDSGMTSSLPGSFSKEEKDTKEIMRDVGAASLIYLPTFQLGYSF